MNTLIVMVGIPGSGKSTRAKELSVNYNATILSSDKIREELYGDERIQENPQKVFSLLFQRMNDLLKTGSVIVDATNTTLKNRLRVLEALKVNGVRKIAYVMRTPFEKCIDNDFCRDRIVGEDVIRKFLNGFQLPQKFEGFDDVIIDGYTFNKYNFNLFEATMKLQEMARFDQKNYHHKYTLFEHCYRLGKSYDRDYKIGRSAGYFHDIGKLYTQSMDKDGVAHYYNHDSIGTYYLLSHLNYFYVETYDDLLESLFLINYHMKARDIRCGKSKNRYFERFGEDRYNRLMQFMKFDMISSGTYVEQ